MQVQRIWHRNLEYASPAALSGLQSTTWGADAAAHGQKLAPLKGSACIGRLSSPTAGGKRGRNSLEVINYLLYSLWMWHGSKSQDKDIKKSWESSPVEMKAGSIYLEAATDGLSPVLIQWNKAQRCRAKKKKWHHFAEDTPQIEKSLVEC